MPTEHTEALCITVCFGCYMCKTALYKTYPCHAGKSFNVKAINHPYYYNLKKGAFMCLSDVFNRFTDTNRKRNQVVKMKFKTQVLEMQSPYSCCFMNI